MNGLVAVRPGRLEARSDLATPEPPAPGEVLVRTVVSAVSPGTELRLLYDPATAFPVVGGTGYMAAGVVEAAGAGVRCLKSGDRVACAATGPHRALLRLPEDQAVRLPEGLNWVDAACAYWIVPPYRGLLGAQVRLWDSAAVVGLGPLGLCAVQLLRGVSRRTLAVDPLASRRAHAERLGASAACAPAEAAEVAAGLLPGGTDVAVELSGTQAGLELALRLAAPRARIAVIGVLPRLNDLELFRPMQDKGIALTPIFRMGASLLGNACDPTAHYLGAALDMVAAGRVEVRSLATWVVPWGEGPAAIARLREHPDEALGLALTWEEMRTDDGNS